MKIHNLQQGTPAWFAVRAGKLTASNASTIQANGKGLETYVLETVASKYSSGTEEGYTNAHMERGNEMEEVARSMYEFEKNAKVEEIGFVELNQWIGCSPDGFVGEDGGVEIKCHANKEHFRLLTGGEISKNYWWQIQMTLYCTKRAWWDYVAYNPNYREELVIRRIEPDKDAFKKLEAGFEKGIDLIHILEDKYIKNSDKN